MKKRLIAALFTALLLCGCALAAQPLHLYLDIPFEGAGPEEINRVLLRERGTSIPIQTDGDIGEAEVTEFGYPWQLDMGFFSRRKGFSQVRLLHSIPLLEGEAEDEQMRGAIDMFINVDRQLTALYGPPNARHFVNGKLGTSAFADGEWHTDVLMRVFQRERILLSQAYWNNVVLHLWYVGSRENRKPAPHDVRITFEAATQKPSRKVTLYTPDATE